jgi:hypothetical protein
MQSKLNVLFFVLFLVSACFLAFLYGVVASRYQLFPYPVLAQAVAAARSIGSEPFRPYATPLRPADLVRDERAASPGLTLLTLLGPNKEMLIRIVDLEGTTVHEWRVDWFEIWPDHDHLDPQGQPGPQSLPGETPQSRPGTHIHGADLLDNGDVVFNFEHLGLVRLDACGGVVWRLPYRTHHSLEVDAAGDIWASGQINHYQTPPPLPNHQAPVVQYTVLHISPDGHIIDEIPVDAILRENDRFGLLYMSSLANRRVEVRGDTLHLNDVEPVPTGMTPGLFRPGDVMISLRNINTVLVFEQATRKIKYLDVGRFVRQHDPDFIDGNTISVFDNNNLDGDDGPPHSRIWRIGVDTGEAEIFYAGDHDRGFFTDIMGKHQWLPNGDLLLTESARGRAFELDPSRRIVWEYVNFLPDGRAGLLEEAKRLDPRFDRDFFGRLQSGCSPRQASGTGR